MTRNNYDVIIIGGRCSGASLAIRLGGKGLKILLLDRSTFPGLPGVPSAPFIHPGVMRLMGELGIEEGEYTHPGSKVEHMVVEMVGHFSQAVPASRMDLDRNYFYGIDRSLFDYVLWTHASRTPGVTARQDFSVTRIVENGKGHARLVSGKASGGQDESFKADLVVGADGRFSFAARQFGADILDENNAYTSAAYFAEWENVPDYTPEIPNPIVTYNTAKSLMVLMIPIAEGRCHIAAVMKSSDANFGANGVEEGYLAQLQRVPSLWERLEPAKQISKVVGMRPIKNGYREAYGPNWALVGDAAHYKDPSDGQGIYDALVMSKLLAEAIVDWKAKGTDWRIAGAAYQQALMDATYPVYKQTVKNVRQNLYVQMPGFLIDTIMRWMINAPEFQVEFMRYLSRAISPADLRPFSLKNLVSGFIADLRSRGTGGEK